MIPLRIKEDVQLLGIQPQVVLAIVTAQALWEKYGAQELTVTSVTEGRHSRTSLHYAGFAVDLRIHGIPVGYRQALRDELAERLGPEFDVILEEDHIHVEWQPKR